MLYFLYFIDDTHTSKNGRKTKKVFVIFPTNMLAGNSNVPYNIKSTVF